MRKSTLLGRISSYAASVFSRASDASAKAVEDAAAKAEHEEKMKKAHWPAPMRRPGNISSTQRRWKPPRKTVVVQTNFEQHTNREGVPLTHEANVRESKTKIRHVTLLTDRHRSLDLLYAKKLRANMARSEAGRWCN